MKKSKLTKLEQEFIEIHTCDDCKEFKPHDYYVIKDAIWEKVAKQNEKLCISCLEKRLHRRIRKRDFTNAPINYVYGFLPLSEASDKIKQTVFNWWQMIPERFWKKNLKG